MQIELYDDNDNLLRHEVVEEDGSISSTEISKYNEEGKLLCCELFMGDSKEVFRKSVLEYAEQGEIDKESVFFEGQLIGGKICYYALDGKLSKQISCTESQQEVVTVYKWHESIPGCCICEEIFTENVLKEIITREWELVNDEPFLKEEHSSSVDQPETARVTRFYNGKEMENGVAIEIYNDQGNFMEEMREQYDSKGRVQRASWHADDEPESTPYKEEIYEYDEQDRVILYQNIYKGRIIHLTKNLYDKNGRLVRCLSKSNMDTHVFFYVHEQVS